MSQQAFPPVTPAPEIAAPLSRGFEYMKRMLFSPFDFRKWAGLALVALLSNCGRGSSGGGNFNFRLPGPGGGFGGPTTTSSGGSFSISPEWIAAGIAIAIVALLVIAAILVLVAWVASRAEFMFIDNIANNRGLVDHPWRELAPLGNSLFRLRIVVWLGGLLFTAILLVLFGVSFGFDFQNFEFTGHVLAAAALLGVIGFFGWLFLALLGFLINNFTAPIMYARNIMAREALAESLTLVRSHVGTCLLYLLVRIGLAIAGGVIVAFVGCLSVCLIVGCIPLVGTYVVTLLTLPVWVFLMSFGICFIEQFGPQYKIIREQEYSEMPLPFGSMPGGPVASWPPGTPLPPAEPWTPGAQAAPPPPPPPAPAAPTGPPPTPSPGWPPPPPPAAPPEGPPPEDRDRGPQPPPPPWQPPS